MQANSFFGHRSSLYLICDGEACQKYGIAPDKFVTAALRGGARIFQYRHKNISVDEYARNLRPLAKLCVAANALMIVNDHAAIAESFGLPLHLGQEDTLPQGLRVDYGRSTHNLEELEIALAAQPQPAYIALGTMFTSPTKPEIPQARALVEDYLLKTNLPLVLIGGITRENAGLLPQNRRIFYAVIGDAFRHGATPAGIEAYARLWL